MSLPKKLLYKLDEVADVLSAKFEEPCDLSTVWSYVATGALHFAVCLDETELGLDVPFDYPGPFSGDDWTILRNGDVLAFVSTKNVPNEHWNWFEYTDISPAPNVEQSWQRWSPEERVCVVDPNMAMNDFDLGGAPGGRTLDQGYITHDELQEFISDNAADRPSEVPLNMQEKRELILSGWVVGMGDQINPESMDLTQKQVWEQLESANKRVFGPYSESTSDKFFKKQNIIIFKPGRRKGG